MANELTSIDGVPLEPYKDGNHRSDGNHNFAYNVMGRLLRVYTPDWATVEMQYEYNADGLRTAKLDGDGKVLERYVYNGGKLAYITDDAGKIRFFFTRSTSGTLLNMIDYTIKDPNNPQASPPQTFWYIKDAHGNVIGLGDRDGKPVTSYEYDAWGNVLSATGTGLTNDGQDLAKVNPFRYSSYFYDEKTKLYYLNARYYSPELGRFLSMDAAPVSAINGLTQNEYLYALNNPTNAVDHEGLALTYHQSDDEAPRYDQPMEDIATPSSNGGITKWLAGVFGGAVADQAIGQELLELGSRNVGIRIPQSLTSHADEVLLDAGKAGAIVDDVGLINPIQAGITAITDVVRYRSNPSLVIGALLVDATFFAVGIGLAAFAVGLLPAALPATAMFWGKVLLQGLVGYGVDYVAGHVKRRAFDQFIR